MENNLNDIKESELSRDDKRKTISMKYHFEIIQIKEEENQFKKFTRGIIRKIK